MYQKSWDELTREEQDLYLVLLWNDGHSEKSIADFFGTTKGRIVRRRNTHLGERMHRGRDRFTTKQWVDPERFRDLVELHALGDPAEEPVDAVPEIAAPPPITATTCQWPIGPGQSVNTLELCGKPTVSDTRLCAEHLALISKK